MQGSGGGPSEGNVSGYLVRSTATKWANNSLLAVDAGTHLSGIIRILEKQASKKSLPSEASTTSVSITSAIEPNGATPEAFAFSGAPLPSEAPKINASFIVRELVSTYLLTHTHLDHLSGFVINTASFTKRHKPKRLAAMPNVISAVKTHIFNDIIWPNLSDEDAGVGLVTYQRLPVAGDYVSVSEGLSAQAWPVSHGHCMKMHTHWGRKSTAGLDPCDGLYDVQSHQAKWCVLDSAVFFIRDEATGRELMMWGDVEPDSVSLDPRNRIVWQEAARKVFLGALSTVFIECSYDGSQPDSALYGHLSPPHLMIELRELADQVEVFRALEQKNRGEKLKRKRLSNGYLNDDPSIEVRRRSNPNPPRQNNTDEAGRFTTPPPPLSSDREMVDVSPRTLVPGAMLPAASATGNTERPLQGLQIVITHVKDTLLDEDIPGKVLSDLRALELVQNLGCTFLLAEQGSSIYI